MTRAARRREDRLELAHALRTPLTSLALGVDLLERGAAGALNAAQLEIARALVRDVARLRAVVDASLSTTRLGVYTGPVERAELDLSEVTRDALRPIEAQAVSRGVTVEHALAPAVVVTGDRARLAWVVATLAGNALRFAPDGSSVRVSVARREDEAVLAVRDRGPGVPREHRAALFARGGPGLALPLAAEIVAAHGGRIALRSRRGRGAELTVLLPLARVARKDPA